MAYKDNDLLISLNNSLKIHDHEIANNKSLLGKFLGLFLSAIDPEWLKIDGTRLIQLHQLANLEPPIFLSASKHYCAEISGLRELLKSSEISAI